MNPPMVFQPEVEGEIDEAFAWYERRRAGLGDEFLREVEGVLDHIRQSPELHALIYRDVRRALIRRFSHAVYDRIEQDRIVVIAVHHSKRNPERWQSRA
jgi:plasmid stabilization system protein ParE